MIESLKKIMFLSVLSWNLRLAVIKIKKDSVAVLLSLCVFILSQQHIKLASLWPETHIKDTHGVNRIYDFFSLSLSFCIFLSSGEVKVSLFRSGRWHKNYFETESWWKLLLANARDKNGSEEFKICFCHRWNWTKSPGRHSSSERCNKVSGMFRL